MRASCSVQVCCCSYHRGSYKSSRGIATQVALTHLLNARRSPLFVSLTNGGFHVANRASGRTAKGRVTDRLALVIISVVATANVVIIIDR